ncbi:hypothetical protein Moror_16517 [Moniliophthora roreri MCA 2997]|uniref:Snurportin-1 n=1 Tax=Moniliophthora roreri (strain MCA 2997) TaxID=1381753 RepID=V2XDA5_MONRO|nr:hypothetical protein Moror_16517 [Moniliophthora roreri MCA 2997]
MSTSTPNRKATYKLPTQLLDLSSSQKSRREKALEEQKRRRAQKVDFSRQLDGFADLNLAGSDEEEENPEGFKIVHQGLASFTSSFEKNEQCSQPSTSPVLSGLLDTSTKKKKKGKRKKTTTRVGGDRNQANKWADKCMYAELLEMNDGTGDMWPMLEGDGLPDDLETGWVAVGPVPVGKRCLAITRESPVNNGVEPNTTLRSRLQGKPLLPWFPSNLPPSTVLDCILDENWKENGILHVLDVLQWKGRDIADCETPFRFWWRDTRLGELARMAPPSNIASSSVSTPSYQFSYPNTVVPVPYHADTSFQSLLGSIIPLARSNRTIGVDVPNLASTSDEMQVDNTSLISSVAVTVVSDGLLLYVAEACYESGTSPLSSWIPLKSYGDQPVQSVGPLDTFERFVYFPIIRAS